MLAAALLRIAVYLSFEIAGCRIINLVSRVIPAIGQEIGGDTFGAGKGSMKRIWSGSTSRNIAQCPLESYWLGQAIRTRLFDEVCAALRACSCQMRRGVQAD